MKIKASATVRQADRVIGATVGERNTSGSAEINRYINPMPTITIGEVDTLPPGSDATASFTGTRTALELNLGLPQGAVGETGPAGPRGERGLRGERGPAGDPGPRGERGAVGPQGPQGPQGERGDRGPTGLTGSRGPQGVQGERGPAGATGAPGPEGQRGPEGQQGPTGEAAGFGTPAASASTLLPTDSATASVTASGPDTAKVFSFSFGIPKGDKGDQGDDYVLTSTDKHEIAGIVGEEIDYAAASSTDTTRTALRSQAIPWGKVDSASTSTSFKATIAGITELKDGTSFWLKNGVVTSASGFKVNINGLGAKKCYSNMTLATQDTTIFNINYTMLFVYDSTLDSGNGGFYIYRGYNSDTNTIAYQVRTNSSVLPTTHRTRYYRMLFTSADNKKWVPANTQYDNSATSAKTVNQEPINPFGRIGYLANTTNYAAGADLPAGSIWQQYVLVLGYSFNNTGAAWNLTPKTPVFVKAAPQSDGSAIIDSTTPIVQTLPSTADGKIYIFLGIAYDATHIELQLTHPIYHYADGAIRLWTNAAAGGAVASVNGQTGAVVLDADDVGALPDTTVIPTVPINVSAFNNDSGYLTLSTLPMYNGEVSR